MLRAPNCVSDHTQLQPTPHHIIDPAREQLLAVAKLCAWHEQRTGKRPHRSVPYRWCREGINGICLPTVQLGGVRYTSEEAIAWWTRQLGARAAGVSS